MRHSESLLLIVAGKEIDGVDVVSLSGNDGVGVLVEPIAEVEGSVGVFSKDSLFLDGLGPAPPVGCAAESLYKKQLGSVEC